VTAVKEGLPVTRLMLIITSLVVGAVLAVGVIFATTALVSSTVAPSNQAPYNYGG
jgi:ABC-type arginine/histidine transport system permease subunit